MEPNNQNNKSKIFVAAGVMLLVGIVGVVYLVMGLPDGPTAEEVFRENISGQLYTSMILKSTPDDFVNVFTYNFNNTRGFEQVTRDDYHFGYEGTENGDEYLISRSPSEALNPFSIYKTNLTDESDMELLETDRVEYSQGLLEWNGPSDSLAYTYQGSKFTEYKDFNDLSNWNIAIRNVSSGEDIILEEASYPNWAPDGEQLLYIKSDGLYLYDVASGTDKSVFTFPSDSEFSFNSQNMLTVSPDGGQIIIITPLLSGYLRYSISNWDDFALYPQEAVRVPNTNFSWPVFSPDSSAYVVQTIDVNSEGDLENARLEFRSATDNSILFNQDISDFDFNQAFIDDWTN
jgi:hypothetical protein